MVEVHLTVACGEKPARRGYSARALLLGLIGVFLTAAPAAAAVPDAEPRVARVSYIEGEASYLNADADEWTAVEVNAPLVTGDRFYSGTEGRAEIQLPAGVDARLSSETELDLLEVSDRTVHLKIGIGTATFRVRDVPAGVHVEFSTPSTALVARARGNYRVDVAQDGQTTVLVREGEADAFLGDDRYRLEKGRGARIVDASYVEGDAPPLEVFDASYVQDDSWDEWEGRRAARLQSSPSYQYVGDDVYGVADLDEYGSWDRHQEYGPIWRPTRVEAGWAPFTSGRWVWQDPWGWTWVDYQPWGWAPSHHGRWVYVRDAWAWAPGPVVARPIYAPATVGFLGVSVNTPSVSVSIGIGPSVGWVPLGYGEPLFPWWGGFGGVQRNRPYWGGWGGPRIVNNKVIKNTNITNINVTNINYTNIDRPRGFNAVSRESFVRGDMQRVDLPHERVREFAKPLRGGLDVVPQRASLFAARPEKLRGGRNRRPSQEILQRAAVSTRETPAARPAFARKLEQIERGKGAPLPPREMQRLAREGAKKTNEAAPRVRTVASRGKRAIVPEVTAQVPGGVPADGRARAARGDARRAALPAERSPGAQRERAQRQQPDQVAPAAREAAPRPDAQSAPQRGRQERTQMDRPGARSNDPRRPEQTDEAAAVPRVEGGPAATERRVPQARSGERQKAEQTQREAATRQQRATQQRERAQVERQQRQQAEQTQRQAATRQQRDTQERERAQVERQQRQQVEKAQRETAARPKRDTQQRESAQVERQQRQKAQQAQQAQREAAEREQRAQQQRQKAPEPQSMKRQPQPQPQASRDERQANRKKKRQQQSGRVLPDA